MTFAPSSAPQLLPGPREHPAPFVTIITAVLNGAPTIGATLESVARQTALARLEHVVVDGGSTDGTIGLVMRAAHRPRLVVEHDHGIYDAFNRGLALARGEWIAFLNADDTYAHDRVVETILAQADRHPDVDAFHADQDWIDVSGRVVRAGRFVQRQPPGTPGEHVNYEQFTHKLPVFHQTTFCRRRLFTAAGPFDSTYRVAGDYDLLLRAWLGGATFRHIPDVFVLMRTGGVSERDRLISDVEVVRAWHRRVEGWLLPALTRLARIGLVHLLERRAAKTIAFARGLKHAISPQRPWGLQDRALIDDQPGSRPAEGPEPERVDA